ncbi:hypothetical protein ZHAS_00003661 [Anopheles sinensis]|uniref:Uncharacterized protein n=1 Tax=Anopheles sinensis TaxID=74873 RepID=A0A084VEY0_ANOSI|nr:hypothetical protein ZHAS_00003661 [Anopheles sinensis]
MSWTNGADRSDEIEAVKLDQGADFEWKLSMLFPTWVRLVFRQACRRLPETARPACRDRDDDNHYRMVTAPGGGKENGLAGPRWL